MPRSRPNRPRPHRSAASLPAALGSLCAWTLLLALSGCASAPSAEAPQPSADGAVADSAAPTSRVLAERISVNVSSRSVFDRWRDAGGRPAADTPSRAQRMVVTREIEPAAADAPEAHTLGMPARAWVVRRFLMNAGETSDDADAAGTLARQMRIVRTEGGGLAISEEINHTEGVRVEFTPPMYILPAELPLDREECVFEDIKMVVRDADRPDRIKAEGTVRHVVCYEADETIRTPAGSFLAHRISSRFEADMGASRVENVTIQWFVPEVGLIAERRHEITRALGVTIRSNRDEWILRSPAGGTDARSQ